jgi:hypothetical protein
MQVLVQGWQVTAKNLPLLMSVVEQQLQELEGRVAEVSGIAQEQLDALRVSIPFLNCNIYMCHRQIMLYALLLYLDGSGKTLKNKEVIK